MERVNNHTRARKQGKYIICPHCQSVGLIYHFAWSRLYCFACRTIVSKNDWYVDHTARSSEAVLARLQELTYVRQDCHKCDEGTYEVDGLDEDCPHCQRGWVYSFLTSDEVNALEDDFELVEKKEIQVMESLQILPKGW